MTGLTKAFPNSARFGNYYRRELDGAGDPVDVDSVTGAFLMIRGKTIDDLGLLDERFFMYCEDEDWCWRSKRRGWRVVYHPGLIAHHDKGSSARQARVRTTWEWHRSLWLYHRKNMAARYPALTNAAVYAGISAVAGVRVPLAWLRDRLSL